MSNEATSALHLQDGNNHVVGLKALRVLLSEDSGCWFAQGLEVDYAAAGASLEEVKKNFAEGLSRTIHEHLVMHGEIGHLLHVAPQDAWDEYLKAPESAIKQSFSTLQLHEIEHPDFAETGAVFPFKEIQFLGLSV